MGSRCVHPCATPPGLCVNRGGGRRYRDGTADAVRPCPGAFPFCRASAPHGASGNRQRTRRRNNGKLASAVIAGRRTSIPFGHKRRSLNRESGQNWNRRLCLARASMPNGIPYTQVRSREGRFSLPPAMAMCSFSVTLCLGEPEIPFCTPALARQSPAFPVFYCACGFRSPFFGKTEWRCGRRQAVGLRGRGAVACIRVQPLRGCVEIVGAAVSTEMEPLKWFALAGGHSLSAGLRPLTGPRVTVSALGDGTTANSRMQSLLDGAPPFRLAINAGR